MVKRELVQPNQVTFKSGELTKTSRNIECVMSTSEVDRMGDIVEQDWDLKDFKRNPIALFQHNASEPIGIWSEVKSEGSRLVGKLKLADAGTSSLIDSLRALVDQNILRAVSVGFSAAEVEMIKDKKGEWTGGLRFIKPSLHECSLVSVPANASALVVAKSHGASSDDLKMLFPDVFRKVETEMLESEPATPFVPSEFILEKMLATRPSLRGLFRA